MCGVDSDKSQHSALQFALPHVLQRTDLLEKVDGNGQSGISDTASDKSVMWVMSSYITN